MGHLISDPPPGSQIEQRDCPDCGKTTVWYLQVIPESVELGGVKPSYSVWVCSGLTAADIAAGR